AIVNHGPRVSDVLTEKFGPRLEEGETVPDFQQVQLFFLGILQAARFRMAEAEAKHVDELAGDDERRTLRQQAFDGLKSTILEQRDFFAGAFGPDQAEMLGFPPQIGRSPMALLRQGERLVQHLTDPTAELPPPRLGQVTLDLVETAASVAPEVEALRSSMDVVGREVKLAQATRLDRDRAVEELDATLLWVARSLEAIYRLAGETELADRIRPATRRPGRPIGEEGEPSSEDETDDGSTPSPPEAIPNDA
ncbi:MAG: hypothetical protein V3T72_00510, partial [Thermoanaerobaculia bacterium]